MIAGVVRAPDELPLGGVEIDICPVCPDTVQSNSDGTYEIVWNDDGKGIAHAKLHPMLRASNWGASFGGDYRNPLRTDANGFYEIKSLPPENRYSLTAGAQGYGVTRVDLVDTREAADKRLDVEVMTLATANLRVSGQVVDDEGCPVAAP